MWRVNAWKQAAEAPTSKGQALQEVSTNIAPVYVRTLERLLD